MSFTMPFSQWDPATRRLLRQTANCESNASDSFDGKLQAKAEAVLSTCPYREVQKINCVLRNGVMFLRGQVSSFYLKQIAQTIMMNIQGVRQVVNAIQVRSTAAANDVTRGNDFHERD